MVRSASTRSWFATMISASSTARRAAKNGQIMNWPHLRLVQPPALVVIIGRSRSLTGSGALSMSPSHSLRSNATRSLASACLSRACGGLVQSTRSASKPARPICAVSLMLLAAIIRLRGHR